MSEIGAMQQQELQGQLAPAEGPGAMRDAMQQSHAALAARYKKLKAAEGVAATTREQLDQLAEMKDMVTQEDVVKAAGKLVAAGSGAEHIASMLVDMPPDGEALAGWIQQKDSAMREMEGQLEAATASARYQMGLAALQHIAAETVHGHFSPPQQPEGGQMNPLTSSAPTAAVGVPNV